MKKRAWFNDNDTKEYRYLLRYKWDSRKLRVLFIMLNPSWADATRSDQTVDNCIEYAKKLGGGTLEVVNLFAYVSPSPKAMFRLKNHDIIGKRTDVFIARAIKRAEKIVVAWGAKGHGFHRNHKVLNMLEESGKDLLCLGISKYGHPVHPGYIPGADKKIVPFVY
ncbi:hypothetical protein CBW65_13950 [Tumebacillus avium]|uniref:DUF1643 domain-containing protein n=1 Tax=Tumebacillus avium TaxID=1903704 RepID=A0A1Y0IN30_9BACL|nr:DUF1643 domain-containing protein [Tumebacillus avium]ARU61982.1 hypothetical protein CBW65_13950 [Tumebacillus avium]